MTCLLNIAGWLLMSSAVIALANGEVFAAVYFITPAIAAAAPLEWRAA